MSLRPRSSSAQPPESSHRRISHFQRTSSRTASPTITAPACCCRTTARSCRCSPCTCRRPASRSSPGGTRALRSPFPGRWISSGTATWGRTGAQGSAPSGGPSGRASSSQGRPPSITVSGGSFPRAWEEGAAGSSGVRALARRRCVAHTAPPYPPTSPTHSLAALKLELWAHAYYYYNWTSADYASCYTWPAVGCVRRDPPARALAPGVPMGMATALRRGRCALLRDGSSYPPYPPAPIMQLRLVRDWQPR